MRHQSSLSSMVAKNKCRVRHIYLMLAPMVTLRGVEVQMSDVANSALIALFGTGQLWTELMRALVHRVGRKA
jgi:hypothetical protein